MINGMSFEEIKKQPYATHLPILQEVFNCTGILNSCLEFGMGYYSTPYLLDNCNHLKSIETDYISWFDKIKGFISSDHWDPICQIGPCAELEHIPDMIQEKYDLILIDGSATSRHVTAQCAQYATSIVVCHDTNSISDFYFSVVLREGWFWIDIKDYIPWTAVATNKKDLVSSLQNKFVSTRVYTGDQLKNKEHV